MTAPTREHYLTELHDLIGALGSDGGLITPSVYDTAEGLRLAPFAAEHDRVLDWLIAQQQPDGGWGDSTFPLTRDLSTLAAVLALHTYRHRSALDRSLAAGLAFLDKQADQWRAPLPLDIPIGVELLFPYLLDQAEAAGLEISRAPYAALIELGARRRQLIARMRPSAGTTAIHSWEAWGTEPDPALLDGAGSIGHSPAATAAWLQAAEGRADLDEARAVARRYLAQASAATGVGIAGVLPTVWPIKRFDQLFGLYALLLADLLDHPMLQDVVRFQLDDLERALPPRGVSFSEFFDPDADDTAAALVVLHAAGRSADLGLLKRFEVGDHFCTWPHELQPSLSATARAVHAHALLGQAPAASQSYLVECQGADGRWVGDKWNNSWLYTTSHMIFALAAAGQKPALRRAIGALARYQHIDGGWGDNGRPTTTETAYGVLALHTLGKQGLLDESGIAMLQRAQSWLIEQGDFGWAEQGVCWIGKELYSPPRVDRMFELSAMLATTMEPPLYSMPVRVGAREPLYQGMMR